MSKTKGIAMFASPSENAPDPLTGSGSQGSKSQYRSEVLKKEYSSLSKGFKQKTNWVRFLPPLQGSSFQWMLSIEMFAQPDGQTLTEFVDPKCYDRSARSAFAEALAWFKANAKENLYNRDKNPTGFKFNSKKMGIAWYIDTSAPEGEKLKLLNTSLYDGTWGGSPGLAFKIWMEANAVETEPGAANEGQKLYGDISDPTTGRLVLIEKNKPEGGDNKYSSYAVRVGKQVQPIAEYMDQLTDEEHQLLCPLENVYKKLSYQEQKAILKDYIGKKWYDQIYPDEASGTTHDEEAPEPTPVKSAATSAPKEPEPTEPEPPAPKAKPEVEPAATQAKFQEAPASEVKFFTIREVQTALGSKAGTQELIDNKHRIQPNHLPVIIAAAEEMGIKP